MNKEPHSPRELARKKREAVALKANLQRRKQAARVLEKVTIEKVDKK